MKSVVCIVLFLSMTAVSAASYQASGVIKIRLTRTDQALVKVQPQLAMNHLEQGLTQGSTRVCLESRFGLPYQLISAGVDGYTVSITPDKAAPGCQSNAMRVTLQRSSSLPPVSTAQSVLTLLVVSE